MAGFSEYNQEKARRARVAWDIALQFPYSPAVEAWVMDVSERGDPYVLAMMGELPPGWEWNPDGEAGLTPVQRILP